jgi:chromosome segregation ATPase
MSWQWSSYGNGGRWSSRTSRTSRSRWSGRGAADWHKNEDAEDWQWHCPSCDTWNWRRHAHCRECEETPPQPKAKLQPLSYADATRGAGLTRQKAESAAKIEALEKAVEHAGDNPHLQDHKKALEAELKKLRRTTNDTRSIAKQIDTLETWIGRERKRIEKLAADLEEAMFALTQRRADLETETVKLTQLKTDMLNEEEGKGKTPSMDVDIEGTSPEAEADAHMLLEKELALRRQMARKRNPEGVALSAKQLKELEAEANQICASLEKRRKVTSAAPAGTAAAEAANQKT